MTEETKQLFDAPWELYEYRDDYDHWFQVLTNGGRLIASRIVNKQDFNRIARLPELYDALVCSVKKSCMRSCGRNKPCESPCHEVKDSIEILRKVRAGE